MTVSSLQLLASGAEWNATGLIPLLFGLLLNDIVLVPLYTTSATIPDIGLVVNLNLRNIQLTNLDVSAADTNISIIDSSYPIGTNTSSTVRLLSLRSAHAGANVSFDWDWKFMGMTGSGYAKLLLGGGVIDYVFHLGPKADAPRLNVLSANSSFVFEKMEASINSNSNNWLYQLVKSMFSTSIDRFISNGIHKVLAEEVPKVLNSQLSRIHANLIGGLAFTNLYDPSISVLSAFSTVLNGNTTAAAAAICPMLSTMTPVNTSAFNAPYSGAPSVWVPPGYLGYSGFLHQAMPNCAARSLFNAGMLKYTMDGATSLVNSWFKPKGFTTAILFDLIPELSGTIGTSTLKLMLEAVAAPNVSIAPHPNPDSGLLTLSTSYRLGFFTPVLNASNYVVSKSLVVFDVVANVSGVVSFDQPLQQVTVKFAHTVRSSSLAVDPLLWDKAFTKIVQKNAVRYSPKDLLNKILNMIFSDSKGPTLNYYNNPRFKAGDGWMGFNIMI